MLIEMRFNWQTVARLIIVSVRRCAQRFGFDLVSLFSFETQRKNVGHSAEVVAQLCYKIAPGSNLQAFK